MGRPDPTLGMDRVRAMINGPRLDLDPTRCLNMPSIRLLDRLYYMDEQNTNGKNTNCTTHVCAFAIPLMSNLELVNRG
jgi:hypothetical protein